MPIRGQEIVDPPEFSTFTLRRVAVRKQFLLWGFYLRSIYDFVVTGGSGAGDIRADAAYRHFQDIRIAYGGEDRIGVAGQTLRLINLFWFPAPLIQGPPLDDAAGATEPGRFSYVFVPTHMFGSFSPYQAALPSYDVDSPTFGVRIAAPEDLVDGGDGDPSYQNGRLELSEVPIFGAPLRPRGREGVNGSARALYGDLEIHQEAQAVEQAGQTKVRVPKATGKQLRAVMVEAFSAGAGGIDYEYDDAVVEEISFVANGRDFLKPIPFERLQQRNVENYELPALETGVAAYDVAEDNRTDVGNLLPVARDFDPYVELAVAPQAGDSRVRVTTVSFAPPKGR